MNGKKRGVTLVELIVVMGILAIIGAVAIPTLARMGAFSRNVKSEGARELANMLKAARVYAATFRVDTAVYYALAEKENTANESGTAEWVPVIDGFGLARGLTDKERREQGARLAAIWGDSGPPLTGAVLDDRLNRVFFPVAGREGELRLMPQGACLPDPAPITDHLGMRSINLYLDEDYDGDFFDEELDGVAPTLDPAPPRVKVEDPMPVPPNYLEYDIPYGFPAHIFRPTGQVDVGYGVPPRIVLEVWPSPDAPFDEQYVEYSSATVNTPVAPVDVYLYTPTGRVEFGS